MSLALLAGPLSTMAADMSKGANNFYKSDKATAQKGPDGKRAFAGYCCRVLKLLRHPTTTSNTQKRCGPEPPFSRRAAQTEVL